MTERNAAPGRPLEETPEVAAAVDDETTVPQLSSDGGPDRDAPEFREVGETPTEPRPEADLIRDPLGGGSGVMVPPADSAALADALQRMLESRPRRLELGWRGRGRVEEEFDIARVADELIRRFAAA